MSSTGHFCVVGFTSPSRNTVLGFLSSHVARWAERPEFRAARWRTAARSTEGTVDAWIKTRR